MSRRTVGELKDEITGVLTGVDLDNVTDLNGALQRAARTLTQQAYIPESTGKANINLYDGVNSYSADSRIFGSTIVDLRPQGNERDSYENVFRNSVKDFDRNKGSLANGVNVAFEYLFGAPILRVDGYNAKTKVVIDDMSLTTGWTAAGSASGLIADETVYYESPASLRFTLTGSSTGTLTKTLDTSLDLTAYEDVGVAFLALQLPNGSTSTNLTSVALRLGSSDSAYDLVSDTEGFLGAWRVGEWLLVALDFSGASSTGTPSWSAIDYVQVRLTHTGTFTNVRVGGLFISLPSAYELLYKSCAIFNDSGTISNTITDDNDEILLNDAAYNLYVHEAAKTIAMQKGGGLASGVIDGLNKTLHGDGKDQGLYALYKAMEPKDTVPFQTSYARLPRIRK